MGARNARRGQRRNQTTAQRQSVWNRVRSQAIKSIVLSLILWIASCIAIWFITSAQLRSSAEVMAAMQMASTVAHLMGYSMYTDNLDTKICLLRTLVLGITELLLMIYPMCEYLFKFHKPIARDPYNWAVAVIVSFITALIVLMIVGSIVAAIGWITVIQLLTIALVILIPRLCFST